MQREDGAVGDAPRLPRRDDDDAHASQPSDAASVVICCRDRAELLEGCLDAVLAACRPGDEVIVVDSASRDSSVRRVAETAGAVVLRSDKPGLSRARNVGWRAARHRIVMFTDDDCRPATDWVQQTAAAFHRDEIGAIWGRVDSDRPEGIELSVLDDTGPQTASYVGDISAVGHGANMAFRRETLEALDGFDPLLGVGARFPAGEDKDAFWRAVARGWQVCFADQVRVVHVHWRPDAEAVRQMYRYGVGAGAVTSKRRRLANQRGLAVDEMWRHGLLPALRAARHRRWPVAAGAMARAAGVVVGAGSARRLVIQAGRFDDID